MDVSKYLTFTTMRIGKYPIVFSSIIGCITGWITDQRGIAIIYLTKYTTYTYLPDSPKPMTYTSHESASHSGHGTLF